MPAWDDLSEEDRLRLAGYMGSFDPKWSVEECKSFALEMYMAIKWIVEHR